MDRMLPDEKLILTSEIQHYGIIVKKDTGKPVRWVNRPSHKTLVKYTIEQVKDMQHPIVQDIISCYNECGWISYDTLETLQNILKRHR